MNMLRTLQPFFNRNLVRSCSTSSGYNYETLAVSKPIPKVVHVEFNRPEKRNSLSSDLWLEYSRFFQEVSEDTDCRAVVLSGRGKMFCAGIDLNSLIELSGRVQDDIDIARNCRTIENFIKNAQYATEAIERCNKPVITAIHDACIGAGTSIIAGADIRYCTNDSWFSIKEVQVGLAPDVGILQRVSRICGNESLVRELLYTGRRFGASEAKDLGLISRIFPSKEECVAGAIAMAKQISKLSPVAVQATKEAILYSREHSVAEGLQFQRIRNSAYLQSEDLKKSAISVWQKQEAEFEDY